MPRFVKPVAAWVLATSVALLVAWQGVGLVTSSVSTDEQVRPAHNLAQDDGPAVVDPADSTPGADDGEDGGGDRAGGGGGADDGRVTDDDASSPTTTARTVVRPGPSTTVARPTTTSPPTTNGAAEGQAAETRTYDLVGGSAALRFSPSGVTVVWATPKQGYETSIEPEHVNGVKVEFRSEAHRSRVDGWWEGGRPVDRIREEPR